MKKLNIITVGYNEEVNLPKLFKSLEYIKFKINIRHIFVDQSSEDKTLKLAKENGCEIYLHKNKGYADPDKKWIIDELLENEDWCLILDCDEELTKNLSDEIIKIDEEKNTNIVYKIKLKVFLIGKVNIYFKQLRLFRKRNIKVSSLIHKYIIKNNSSKFVLLQNRIINKDNKNRNKSIFNHINKINSYSENELKKYSKIGKYKITLYILYKPFITFLEWGIYHRLLFQGLGGIIILVNMTFYTFSIYSKLYEKNVLKNN